MIVYVLTDQRTGQRLPYPNEFNTQTAAVMFAMIHDIRNYEIELIRRDEQETPLLPF